MENKDLLSDEQELKKVVKTPEEIVALAKEGGVELTDEQIEKISGGSWIGENTEYICTCCGCGREFTVIKGVATMCCPYCGQLNGLFRWD